MSSLSDYLAIPADAGATHARLWLGCVVEPPTDAARIWIEHPSSGARWPVGAWQRWAVPNEPARFVCYQRLSLDGLAPDTRYPVVLRVDGQIRATAELRTLPMSLPALDSTPFTIMLGSCFCRQQDDSGRVGRTFVQLPDGSKPSVKFLVGDQVYLDSPWYRWTAPHTTRALGSAFLDQYLRTWDQRSDAQGFNQLLSTGANYFCADDHEFWNNAPFPCTFAVNTWTAPGRDAWWKQALALYRAFQADGPTQLDVGDLSIRVFDTRVNRAPERSNFVTPQQMASLRTWIMGLTAPGILVVGQPVFAGKAGFMGRFADWNLPDFAQYAELCQMLQASTQSILLMTGDVHYGRLASVALPNGAELVELISSPMALVDRSAGGAWHQAPGRFPAEPIPGVRSLPVTTDQTWTRFANHFVTVDLNSSAGGLRVRIRAWETEPADGITRGRVVAERDLMRMA